MRCHCTEAEELRAEVERLREDADHTSCVESYTALRARLDALVADLRGLAETFGRWPSSPSLSVAARHIRAVLDKHADTP